MSSNSGFLASLNLGTIVIAVLIVGAILLFFIRKRSNRHSMEGREHRNVGADIDAGRDAPAESRRE